MKRSFAGRAFRAAFIAVVLFVAPGTAMSVDITPGFEPGLGPPVGTVQRIQGEALVIHGETGTPGSPELPTFRLDSGLPLFESDRLFTQPQSYLSILLTDGSQFSLGPDASVNLSQVVYEPDKGSRSSFIDMGLGKVRFWVRKFTGFSRSEFKVKTRTAVLGVRGSDFAVRSTPDFTEVVTLDDTRLEVIAVAAPSAPPVDMGPFEKAVIQMDMASVMIESLRPEDVEGYIQDVPVIDSGDLTRSEDRWRANQGIRVSGNTLVPAPRMDAESATQIEEQELVRPPDDASAQNSAQGAQDTFLDERVVASPESPEPPGQPSIPQEAPAFPPRPDVAP